MIGSRVRARGRSTGRSAGRLGEEGDRSSAGVRQLQHRSASAPRRATSSLPVAGCRRWQFPLSELDALHAHRRPARNSSRPSAAARRATSPGSRRRLAGACAGSAPRSRAGSAPDRGRPVGGPRTRPRTTGRRHAAGRGRARPVISVETPRMASAAHGPCGARSHSRMGLTPQRRVDARGKFPSSSTKARGRPARCRAAASRAADDEIEEVRERLRRIGRRRHRRRARVRVIGADDARPRRARVAKRREVIARDRSGSARGGDARHVARRPRNLDAVAAAEQQAAAFVGASAPRRPASRPRPRVDRVAGAHHSPGGAALTRRFDDQRDAHAAADAQRRHAEAAAARSQRVHQRGQHARAAGADRMAERDRAAVAR